MLQQEMATSAIRDSLAEVFRHPDYNRTLKDTVWDIIMRWIADMFSRLVDAARANPAIVLALKILVLVAVGLVLLRVIYLAYQRARLKAEALKNSGGLAGTDMENAWLLAQKLSTEGRYTEAAHALYWHLLQWLRQSESIRLHPSKTVGDYARDLRNKPSRFFHSYREFARSYEVVIYGLGTCDRERYNRLLSMATALTQKNV